MSRGYSNRNEKHSRHRHHKKKRLWLRWLIGIFLVVLVVDMAVVYKLYRDANTAVTSSYKKVRHDGNRSELLDFRKGGTIFCTVAWCRHWQFWSPWSGSV